MFLYTTLCLRIRIGSSAFCREAMKWRSGGFRGHPALILLPVRTSPPRLLAADGSHVPALRMSARWKENISQITTGRPIHSPHPPRTPLSNNLTFEALSETAGTRVDFLVGSENSDAQKTQPPSGEFSRWFSVVARCLRGRSGLQLNVSFISTKCISQQPFYLKTLLHPTSPSRLVEAVSLFLCCGGAAQVWGWLNLGADLLSGRGRALLRLACAGVCCRSTRSLEMLKVH